VIELKDKKDLEIPSFLRNQSDSDTKDKKLKHEDDDFVSITDIGPKLTGKYGKQAKIREDIKWSIVNIIKEAKIPLGPRILFSLVKQQVPEANIGQISRQVRNLLQIQTINKNDKRKITKGKYFKAYAKKRRF